MSEVVSTQGGIRPKATTAICNRELSEEAVESIAAMLRVLADPTRIRLIERMNNLGPATVSALSSFLPLTQQGVSRQLAILHQSGVVRRRREGVRVYYELADFTGLWVFEQLASASS